MGYNVSAISDYVKNSQDTLIKDVIFAPEFGDTISKLAKQLGVKTKERLNYLAVDPVIQSGEDCGFNAEGSVDFTEKDVEVAPLKVQSEFCDRDLLGKYAEFLVKTASNKDMADMPFEREIMNEIIKGINIKLEKGVWQGTKAVDHFDGFITLAKGADAAQTVNVTFASGDTAYEKAKKMVLALPERILDDATIFVSPANYRALVLELVEKNLYHFAPNAEIEDKDIVIPGTNVRVHKTMGLSGSNAWYASSYKNMVYATDLMNDNETVKAWYDENTELFKYSIRWNTGVATYFSDLVVLGE